MVVRADSSTPVVKGGVGVRVLGPVHMLHLLVRGQFSYVQRWHFHFFLPSPPAPATFPVPPRFPLRPLLVLLLWTSESPPPTATEAPPTAPTPLAYPMMESPQEYPRMESPLAYPRLDSFEEDEEERDKRPFASLRSPGGSLRNVLMRVAPHMVHCPVLGQLRKVQLEQAHLPLVLHLLVPFTACCDV